MPMIEISKKQFDGLIDDYISELERTEDLEKLIMKILRRAILFEDLDWSQIAKFVNKTLKKQTKDIEW